MELKKNDIEIYLILGGVAIAAYFFLPPIFKLLALPGEIIDAPGELVKTLKNNQIQDATDTAAIDEAKLSNQNTSIPGLSTDQLSAIVDQKAYAKFDNTPVRSSPHSNSSVLKYVNTGDSVGVIYSAAGEQLGTKVNIWLWLTDIVGGAAIGWIRYTDVSIPDAGISCLSCSSKSVGCLSCTNKKSVGFNQFVN